MGQENCKNIPHESMGSMGYRPWKTMESMGIYKNESMQRMVFSSILLLIISGKHGKHEICANEFMPPWFPGSSWLSWPLLGP